MASNMKAPKINYMMIGYVIIAVFIIAWGFWSNTGTPQETSWSMVKNQLLESGGVEKIEVVNGKKVKVFLTEAKLEEMKQDPKYKNLPSSGNQFEFNIGTLEKFETDFEQAQSDVPENQRVPIEFTEERSIWRDLLGSFLPLILIFVVFFLIMRNMSKGGKGGGGLFNVGKSTARMYDKNSDARVTFKDVAGLEEVKVEVMEIVDFLRNPKKYSDLGGKIPKGVLLVGPPGTGKTLLAKAVAGEADVPFFSMSGSDFVEMFVGVGASRVRDLFKQAKDKAPCIVFIDEIDAIGRARSKNGGYSSNDERENTLNQLLTEMDGFGTNAGVIIIAATNRADILDKALMRAGRFDRQIMVELPDLTEREAIIRVHIKRLKLADDFDPTFFARQTPGFSGADLANVCNEAALIAARKSKDKVYKQDFLDAIDRIIGGVERKNKIMTEGERRTIAFHEAGHATVSWHMHYANPLIKVTIVPRGKALGAAWYMPEERQITTREQLAHQMSSILGGRAAEEVIFGEISTGALNDLERATKQAYAMVAYYGMSDKMANISYYDSEGRELFSKPYSEKRAEEIDAEVKELIDSAYENAKKILREHEAGFRQLAELLLEKEVVFTDDLERIFGKRQGGTTPESVREEPEVVEVKEVIEVFEPQTEEPSAGEAGKTETEKNREDRSKENDEK